MSETQTPKRKRRVTGPGARESAESRLSAGVVERDGMRLEWRSETTAEGVNMVATLGMMPGHVMVGAGRPGNGLRRDATATVREPLLLMAPEPPLASAIRHRYWKLDGQREKAGIRRRNRIHERCCALIDAYWACVVREGYECTEDLGVFAPGRRVH